MSSHDSKFVMWLRKHKIVLLHVQTLPVVFAAVQAYLHIFILHIPQYRCQVTNDSTAIQESSKYMGGQSVPIYSSISEGKEHSSCNIYYRHLSYTTPNLEKEDDSVYHYECRQWIYNKSYFDNTFAMQENLVCRKMLFRTHAIGAFMVGFTIGSLVLGLISDSKGRKMAFLLSSALHFFSTTFLTWITDFWIFLFFRFLVGASVGGLLGTTYVMNQLFTNILSFIGKFGTSSAFTTIFLYSAEFFHTPIRHTGFGVADFSARLGGIATPYIVDSGVLIGGDIGRVFHMVMYGISAVVASLLMLMLPETKRNPELPNTMLKTKPNHEAHLESK